MTLYLSRVLAGANLDLQFNLESQPDSPLRWVVRFTGPDVPMLTAENGKLRISDFQRPRRTSPPSFWMVLARRAANLADSSPLDARQLCRDSQLVEILRFAYGHGFRACPELVEGCRNRNICNAA